MKRPVIIATVAAILAATAQSASLLDSVLNEEKNTTIEALEVLDTPLVLEPDNSILMPDVVISEITTNSVGMADESISYRKKAKGHLLNPTTFYLCGGGGGNSAVASAEWTKPIGSSAFDISIRGFYLQTEKMVAKKETYYTYSYWYSWWSGWHTTRHRHTHTYYTTVKQSNGGGEALCLWRPFRQKRISPYAGLGLRYENISNDLDKDEKGGASVAARIGVSLNLKRIFITGEYITGSDSSELIGDLSFYLTRRCKLHAFVESIDLDLKSATVAGGGLSFDF